MIKSKKLSKINNLKHGFFNSNGGISKNIYRSLNCGPGSKDKLSNVKKNLELVRKKIKKSARDIFLLNQIHSNKFIYIDEKYQYKSKPKVDAVITNQKNLPIAILTADCAPVLICDHQTKIIAAVHAGWRGAYKGIVDRVIKFMIKKGSKPQNITAVIGPSISIDNYEVQSDFKNKFLKKDRRNKIFFRKKRKRLYFDLSNYVKSILLKNKIKKIEKIKIDTFDFRNKFFSARRALSLKHDDYGRNISIIMLN